MALRPTGDCDAVDWASKRWRDQAGCRESDPSLFFPVGTTGEALNQIQAAKRVCKTCPVRTECLAFALETNQEGVWGGTSEDERRTMRRAAIASRPSQHPTVAVALEVVTG